MGKIITIANQKGGVSKTLTASSMASILTTKGYKILTISLDPQRNFDMVAGELDNGCPVLIQANDTDTLSMLHVMNGSCEIGDAIVHTQIGDIARASSLLTQWSGNIILTKKEYLEIREDLAALQSVLDERIGKDSDMKSILYKRLQPILDDYEFILIDTNPSLTLLTTNALYAADYIIIPAFSEEPSASAIEEMYTIIRGFNYINKMNGIDRTIKILGILMTKCNLKSLPYKQCVDVYSKFASAMNTRLFDTRIRQSIRATDYVASGMDLIRYAPNCPPAEDYKEFVAEFLRCMEEEGYVPKHA